jgi:hypothetical protein
MQGRARTLNLPSPSRTIDEAEDEVDPFTGKPLMLDGRPYHQECRSQSIDEG